MNLQTLKHYERSGAPCVAKKVLSVTGLSELSLTFFLVFASLFLSFSSSSAQTKNATTTATPSPSPAASVSAKPAPYPSRKARTSKSSSAASPKTAAAKGAVVLPPEKANPVTIPRFEKPPAIDGKLDEEVWKEAALLKDFYQIQPGDNVAPSKPTEVLIGYDPKFLYIAFRVTDEPDKVRATVAKRDNIFNDDYVGFMLDTFNDKRKAFEMFLHPLGIQGDGS